ncbi:MAG: hypothetical protein HY049_09915 [Acidobacteria bacterium]|nr:hypothetical protein [Acidobacteriota bacterium]
MPTITQDVLMYHRLQKDAEPAEVILTAGDQVHIIKEWARHYLIKIGDGKIFNIPKDYVDPSS